MMSIARTLIVLVAVERLYILALEMFLWRTRGLKVFGMTPEFAETTAVLAKNQGLYNGFLAPARRLREPAASGSARLARMDARREEGTDEDFIRPVAAFHFFSKLLQATRAPASLSA